MPTTAYYQQPRTYAPATIPDDYERIEPAGKDLFPVKDSLKKLGCKWDAEARRWCHPPGMEEEVASIVAEAPALQPRAKLDTSGWVALTGSTFPVRDRLKQMGAQWNGDIKAWVIAPEKAAAAKAIIPTPTRRAAAPTKQCWECGRSFTYADAAKNHGDWADGYCGC
jgi:hypothetical protein